MKSKRERSSFFDTKPDESENFSKFLSKASISRLSKTRRERLENQMGKKDHTSSAFLLQHIRDAVEPGGTHADKPPKKDYAKRNQLLQQIKDVVTTDSVKTQPIMADAVPQEAPSAPQAAQPVPAASDPASKKGIMVTRGMLIWFVVVVIAVLGVANGIYYYVQYQNTQKLLKNSVLGAQDESKVLTEKVGALVELPKEEATVATVSDVSKLKNHALFKNARNGDKVLIFQNAQRAVLYRPSVNKVIDLGPINAGNNNNTQSSSPSAQTDTPALF